MPANRPRWVPLPDHAGWVPLEQVIADNLSALFPRASELACSFFRVSRGAKDDPWTDQAGEDVAPHDLRERFTALIRREADHARAGRPCGVRARMNQLQDPAWDMQSDGRYIRRHPAAGEARRGVQQLFIERSALCLA